MCGQYHRVLLSATVGSVGILPMTTTTLRVHVTPSHIRRSRQPPAASNDARTQAIMPHCSTLQVEPAAALHRPGAEQERTSESCDCPSQRQSATFHCLAMRMGRGGYGHGADYSGHGLLLIAVSVMLLSLYITVHALYPTTIVVGLKDISGHNCI